MIFFLASGIHPDKFYTMIYSDPLRAHRDFRKTPYCRPDTRYSIKSIQQFEKPKLSEKKWKIFDVLNKNKSTFGCAYLVRTIHF